MKERSPLRNLSTLLLLLLSATVLAQETQDETPAEKFTVHGYLTQAFAKSDGDQVLGIGNEGTTDYRRGAAYEDWAAGATFAARPDVVLKAEYHWSESQLLETNIRPLGTPSRPVNYGIVSMSVSF